LILVDTNVFLIDRFFPRDKNYNENKIFVDNLINVEAYISIFSLIELCGIASFNLSEYELNLWFFSFDKVYNVTVLETIITAEMSAEAFFEAFIEGLYGEIRKKMTFADALILKEAKAHNIPTIVTWNKKHFEHRSQVKILTPAEFKRMLVQNSGIS